MSVVTPKADISGARSDVSFWPNSNIDDIGSHFRRLAGLQQAFAAKVQWMRVRVWTGVANGPDPS